MPHLAEPRARLGPERPEELPQVHMGPACAAPTSLSYTSLRLPEGGEDKPGHLSTDLCLKGQRASNVPSIQPPDSLYLLAGAWDQAVIAGGQPGGFVA